MSKHELRAELAEVRESIVRDAIQRMADAFDEIPAHRQVAVLGAALDSLSADDRERLRRALMPEGEG